MFQLLPCSYPEPLSVSQYHLLELIAFLGDEAHLENLLNEVGADFGNASKVIGLMMRLHRLADAGLIVFDRQRPNFSSKHPFRNRIIFRLDLDGRLMLSAMRAYRDAYVAEIRQMPPLTG